MAAMRPSWRREKPRWRKSRICGWLRTRSIMSPYRRCQLSNSVSGTEGRGTVSWRPGACRRRAGFPRLRFWDQLDGPDAAVDIQSNGGFRMVVRTVKVAVAFPAEAVGADGADAAFDFGVDAHIGRNAHNRFTHAAAN